MDDILTNADARAATLEAMVLDEDDSRPWLCLVSGGSDSTALAFLTAGSLRRRPRPLALFHANHHLRGGASDGDAAFVATVAEQLELPLFRADLDVEAAVAAGENLEAAARRLRYAAAHDALDRWCAAMDRDGADGLLLVAHTLDDRVENFYMRSIVGTGPGGFRGMDRRAERLWRPLLDARRQELRAYLLGLDADRAVVDERTGLRWCEDATNDETNRLRAFVRRRLIPPLEERAPSFRGALRRSMDLIADEDDFMDGLAREAAAAHLTWADDGATGRAADNAEDVNAAASADGAAGDASAAGRAAAKDGPPTDGGFQLDPAFGLVPTAVARRVVHKALATMAGPDARIDARTVDAVLGAFADGRPISGYVVNVQGNLAVSANRRGVRVEPMARFRARRKPGRSG